MFAITLGVIVSVALSLLCESLALSLKIEEQAILALKEVVPGMLKKVNLSKSYRIFPIGKAIHLLVSGVFFC